MINFLRSLVRNIPTFFLAFALALAVWVSSVTASDPTEERLYPRTISLKVVGLDPGMVLVSDVPSQVNLTLSAPQSIWSRLINEQISVNAVLDLSGLDGGNYDVPVQIQVGIRPVRIISYSPQSVEIALEKQSSRAMPINLVRKGEPAVGFRAENPILSQASVTISGPESLVEKVEEVRATLELNNANENIESSLILTIYDEAGIEVNGLSVTPEEVVVTQRITQRGGYRNVVVKVVVTGQVSSGYRVTNISVYPPAVTVFSSDPKLVEQLPGYVETQPLDLGSAKDDLDVQLNMSLPSGVSVVGEETVEVQVGIAAIEGSVTISQIPVEISGLADGLEAVAAPEVVDVILSGPIPVLDLLLPEDIRVYINMPEEGAGIYQRVPTVEVSDPDVSVESVLPASIEVTIKNAPQGSGTATPTVGP